MILRVHLFVCICDTSHYVSKYLMTVHLVTPSAAFQIVWFNSVVISVSSRGKLWEVSLLAEVISDNFYCYWCIQFYLLFVLNCHLWAYCHCIVYENILFYFGIVGFKIDFELYLDVNTVLSDSWLGISFSMVSCYVLTFMFTLLNVYYFRCIVYVFSLIWSAWYDNAYYFLTLDSNL